MRRALLLLAVVSASTVALSRVAANEPAGGGTLTIHVISDVNENGVRDGGEPGVEGWKILVGCGDAFVSLPPTDAAGQVIFDGLRGTDCANLSVEFGWLSTSPTRLVFDATDDVEVLFLVRHVGTDVQRFTGYAIDGGGPAAGTAALDALIGAASCIERKAGVRSGLRYELYVLGSTERAGCAEDGGEIVFTIAGNSAGTAIFRSRETEQMDLVAGHVPMYFTFSYYLLGVSGPVVPRIESQECGTAVMNPGGFVPPNYQTVFVVAHAQQTGCGSSGRVVNLEAGGNVVAQFLWRPGRVSSLRELGDANCDYERNSVDAAVILQFEAGLLPDLACGEEADVGRDGSVGATDAVLVLQLAAGLIPYFP